MKKENLCIEDIYYKNINISNFEKKGWPLYEECITINMYITHIVVSIHSSNLYIINKFGRMKKNIGYIMFHNFPKGFLRQLVEGVTLIDISISVTINLLDKFKEIYK